MTFRPPIIVTIYPPRKVASETYNVTILPLLAPNPAQPFKQTDWPRPQGPGKVQASDAPANLFPTFHPNPTQPFVQVLWESPTRPLPKVPSETIGGAIGGAAPPKPFKQTDWLLATTPRSKVADTSVGTVSPLLTPNPAQPFFNPPEVRIFGLPPIKSEIFVNLLPLQSVPVVVLPFAQGDWPLPTSARGKICADSLSLSLPLNFPNPPQPFTQTDWINPVIAAKLSDRSFTQSTSYIPSPPPPVGITFEWLIRSRRRGRR